MGTQPTAHFFFIVLIHVMNMERMMTLPSNSGKHALSSILYLPPLPNVWVYDDLVNVIVATMSSLPWELTTTSQWTSICQPHHCNSDHHVVSSSLMYLHHFPMYEHMMISSTWSLIYIVSPLPNVWAIPTFVALHFVAKRMRGLWYIFTTQYFAPIGPILYTNLWFDK